MIECEADDDVGRPPTCGPQPRPHTGSCAFLGGWPAMARRSWSRWWRRQQGCRWEKNAMENCPCFGLGSCWSSERSTRRSSMRRLRSVADSVNSGIPFLVPTTSSSPTSSAARDLMAARASGVSPDDALRDGPWHEARGRDADIWDARPCPGALSSSYCWICSCSGQCVRRRYVI